MVRRVGFVAALVGLGLAASASPASAGVTLGEAGSPTAYCGADAWLAQTATGSPPGYAVPAGYGVITSWSFEGEATPGTGRLLVWRPTAAPNQYILVHKSSPETFAAGIVRTFAVRFPVHPNDILGMEADQSCLLLVGFPGDVARYVASGTELNEGSTQTLGTAIPQERLLVSARVEVDADHDNFGDETQDQCPTDASTQGPCPVAPVTPVTTTKKKCKKHKKKHSASSAKKKCKKKKHH
jgi:hypothetical protein